MTVEWLDLNRISAPNHDFTAVTVSQDHSRATSGERLRLGCGSVVVVAQTSGWSDSDDCEKY